MATPGRPRKEENRRTRELILEAALDLFAENGYPATTMRQIAHRVGVTEAAIYCHFKNKADLLAALFQLIGMDEFNETLVNIDKEALVRDPEAVMCQFVLSILHEQMSELHQKLFRVHVTEFLRLQGQPCEAFFAEAETTMKSMQETFRFLMEKGIIRTADTDVLTLQFMAPLAVARFDYFISRGLFAQDLGRLEDFVRRHVRTFFSFLLIRSPNAQAPEPGT